MTPSSRPGIRFTPQRVRATGGVGPGRALSPAPAGLRHDSSSWHIPLSAIEPDPHQPRRTFDQDPLQSLADSIAEGGLRMPITVRRVAEGEDRFIIVTGERRWRASQLAGLDTIRAFIKEVEEATVVGVVAEQIDENSQREPLTIIETGRGLRRLRHEMAHATGSDPNALDEEDDADDGAAGGGARMTTRARAYSWRSVARQAHMPYATAMRSVYATRYPDVVAAVEDRTISGAVAVEIAQVRDSDERAGLLERARAEHLSAPQVARIRDGQPASRWTSRRTPRRGVPRIGRGRGSPILPWTRREPRPPRASRMVVAHVRRQTATRCRKASMRRRMIRGPGRGHGPVRTRALPSMLVRRRRPKDGIPSRSRRQAPPVRRPPHWAPFPPR